MKSRKNVLACLLIFCGLMGFLILDGENNYMDLVFYEELVSSEELVFSEESGFYQEPFELELYAPEGTDIYYTLDGSEPDKNAIRYIEPIHINDASDNDNVYSLRNDVSAGFMVEEIEKYSRDNPKYIIPNYNIDKCTVVRAVFIDAYGNYSEIKTKSYFVSYEDKMGYDGMNIISIVTDPDNLFDYDSGIYILGQTYDKFVNDSGMEQTPLWWWWNANYRQRGLEWERPADIQLFNTEKELLLEQECGIRIQGGGSRGKLPRSINIYTGEKYSGDSRFYVDLFGTGYMPETMTLFAGGDDTLSKFRDRLMAGLIKDRTFSTMNYEPCAMFLDGEYWGVYWLTEKYDDVFLEYYYGVERDNVVMIKSDDLVEGEEYDEKLYREMMEYMTSADLSVYENYEYACQLMDIQSLIDYFAAEIYIGRCSDWPDNNFALWRTREKSGEEYGDGKWRWMLYDVNSGALSGELTAIDTISNTMNTSEMFCNLCRNEDFKRQFVITFMDIVNTCFTSDRVDLAFSDYLATMSDPMSVHLKRFFAAEDNSKFLNAVEDIKYFLDNRKPYAVQYLKEDFGLTGNLALVEVGINDAVAGNIIINTAELTFDDSAKWNGEYFTDYPITLAAVANEGYKFVGWKQSNVADKETNDTVLLEEENIELTFDEEGISIQAIFEKVN